MVGNGVKVAIYDPSATGGITHYTFQLAEGLARAGCRVTVMTSTDYELRALQRPFAVWYLFKPSRLRALASRLRKFGGRDRAQGLARSLPNAPVPRRPASGRLIDLFRSLRLTAVLLKAAFKLRVDGTHIVHVHWLLDRRADLVFIRALRRLGIRIVYTVHDVLPHDEHTEENKAFFGRLYRYPDKLIVHSEKNRREMLDLFAIDPERLCVIPHGRHGLFFEWFGTSARAARDRLAIPQGVKVVLFFGLIRRYKGLEYLLQAFDAIAERCANVLLLVAGRIPDNDPASRRHYEPILARYAGRPNVKFHDAYIPFDRVADYFTAADLVVIPYARASQSGVLLTAYAAGRAVIATDVGGLGEVVRNGISGLVVPPRDSAAIAASAITLLDDDRLRETMGREALRLAESVYAWTTIAETTVKVYQSVSSPNENVPDSHAMVA